MSAFEYTRHKTKDGYHFMMEHLSWDKQMSDYSNHSYFKDAIENLKGCERGEWRDTDFSAFEILVPDVTDLTSDEFAMVYIDFMELGAYNAISSNIVAQNIEDHGDEYDLYYDGYLVFRTAWLNEVCK